MKRNKKGTCLYVCVCVCMYVCIFVCIRLFVCVGGVGINEEDKRKKTSRGRVGYTRYMSDQLKLELISYVKKKKIYI